MYMYHKQPPPPVIKGGRNVAEIVSHFLKNPLRGKYIENYKISLKYINIVLYSWKVLLFNLGIVKVLHPSKNKKGYSSKHGQENDFFISAAKCHFTNNGWLKCSSWRTTTTTKSQ